MLIRDEQADDATVIHQLIAASFPTDAESRLVDLLRASGRLSFSLLAVKDERVVGHIGFSPVTTAIGGATTGLGLAPLAVAESERQRGIGEALVRAGLQRCREAAIPYVVVLGAPDYYGRFGFSAAAEFGLYDAYGGGAEFQVLELGKAGAPRDGGLVQYAPEFAIFGGDGTH